MRISHIVTLLLFSAVPVFGIAEPSGSFETDPSVVHGTRAKPLQRPGPKYPQFQRRKGQEGWVVFSFVVGTDGLVHDPIIDDSSGIPAFEKSVLQMAESWRYEPATWNGKPVEQAKTKTRITFALEGPQSRRGASEKYIKRERKFDRLLKSGDVEGAGEFLDLSFERTGWNLYETTRLWLSSYRLFAARADYENQLKSIRRASTEDSGCDRRPRSTYFG